MQQFMDWRKDYANSLDPKAVARRRAFLRTLTRRDVKNIELALLPHAQNGRQYLVSENARPFQGRLDFITEVRLETTMEGLLALAADHRVDRRVVRQRLEALMTFDAAAGMYELERRSSYAQGKRTLLDFNRRFAEEFFDGSVEMPVWSSHDVNDRYHLTRVSYADPGFKKTRHVIRQTLFCRQMRLGDKTIPVVYDYRLKGRFEEWLKIQKQYDIPRKRSDAFQIHDRCGLRFVVPEDAQVAPVLEVIEQFLAKETSFGASIIERPNAHAPSRDPENRHSADRFVVAKLTVAVAGQFFEIQVQSMRHYLATRTSTDAVNHDVYRLRQCMDVYFPLLFPPEVYGVDWRSEVVRKELEEWKIRSLGLLADLRIRRNH